MVLPSLQKIINPLIDQKREVVVNNAKANPKIFKRSESEAWVENC